MKRINISYNQIAIFKPKIENPFNEWNDEILKQGISYRTDSACFECLGDSIYNISIQRKELQEIDISSFERIYQIPLCEPSEGLEIASITDSFQVDLPSNIRSYCFLINHTEIIIALSEILTEVNIIKLDKPTPDKLILNSKPAN